MHEMAQNDTQTQRKTSILLDSSAQLAGSVNNLPARAVFILWKMFSGIGNSPIEWPG